MSDERYIPVSEIEDRIGEIDELLRALPIERSMLEKLRVRAVSVTRANVNGQCQPVTQTASQIAGTGMKPRPAVLAFVLANPGRDSSAIVNALQDGIESNAEDKRSLLHATVYQLKKAGLIVADAHGSLSIPVARMSDARKILAEAQS